MAISHVTKLYAVDDCKIYAMTADTSGGSTTYGSAIDIPGIKSVGVTFQLNSKELRGDNGQIESDSTLTGIDVTFNHAKISLDAMAAMMGGAVADAGSGSTETSTFSRNQSHNFSYFKLEAKTPANGADLSGGDVHMVFYKLKLTGVSGFGFAEEDYQIPSQTARGVYRLSDGKLFDVVINETAAALAA